MHEPDTSHEETVNALTHAFGVLASIVGGAVAVVLAARLGDAWLLAGTIVYSISLVLLYTASTLYHAARPGVVKARLRIFDHSAIFLLIAGTYTPFMLGALRDAHGWALLWTVWALATAGVVYKLFLVGRYPRLSTALYLGMGWLAVVALPGMLRTLSLSTLLWLMAGGVAYTSGTLFFHSRRIPYAHAIWHGFVLAGSACHFVAVVLQLLAPPPA